MILPESNADLAAWAVDRIKECRVSVGQRSAMARSLRTWRYTGSPDSNPAILNMLDPTVDRMASYLYSPTNLRFHMDFTNTYQKPTLDMADVAARVVTRKFSDPRTSIDLLCAKGIDTALTYGACIPKLSWQFGGLSANLVMPWQFGVYQERKQGLEAQECMVETNWITPMDLWRRISHLPNRDDLYKRAKNYATTSAGVDESELGYFHTLIIAGSSPSVQTELPYVTTTGGMMSTAADPGGGMMAAEVSSELIPLHELWVRNDVTSDWTTIQLIEPDILIAPQTVRRNMFVKNTIPYGLFQPNDFIGNFWGRTEMAGILKLQMMLKDRLEDLKKIMSLQYDRRIAVIGGSGMNDELYDAFKMAGWLALEAGADIKDMTPEVPKEAFAEIQQLMSFIGEVNGFTPVMNGDPMPGVRADNQQQTLMRNASPRMRDRALICERQVADLGNKALDLLVAKDATKYLTDAEQPVEFLLSQLPEDRRINVDSHSSSPIYEEDNMQKIGFLAKLGFIGGEATIDAMGLQEGELYKQEYRTKEAAQAAQMNQLQQTNPDAFAKAMGKGKAH